MRLMYLDDILQEIRDFRDAYAKRFGYNIRALVQDLKKREEESKADGRRFVSFPPRMARVPDDQVKPTVIAIGDV